MGKPEEHLQLALCRWIAHKYPGVLFNSDMSGVRLHQGLRARMAKMRSHKHFPDLHIMKAQGHFHGMFLELKAPGTRVWLKDGTVSKDKHIHSQHLMLEHLYNEGYYAVFAVGIDMAMDKIDFYMNLKK